MTINDTCHCGDLEFTLQNDPMMHFMCHCTDCHKIWNNSFFSYAYALDDIKISGKTNTYCYDGGSGNKMNILFCPSCATKIYIQPELIDGMIYIPIGLLKEHYEFNPKVEIFSYNKPRCLSNLNVTVESYDHNGTIERISELLENLEQR